jgi:hypothetical protein
VILLEHQITQVAWGGQAPMMSLPRHAASASHPFAKE